MNRTRRVVSLQVTTLLCALLLAGATLAAAAGRRTLASNAPADDSSAALNAERPLHVASPPTSKARLRPDAHSQAAEQGTAIWLDGGRQLPVTYKGTANAQRAMQDSQSRALSMASDDFDGDGIADLVVGYAGSTGGIISLQRGNLDAFAPQSEDSWQAIGQSRFPSPFLNEARALEVPVNPDFLVVGDFNGDGYNDILIAARGGQSLYLLAGDGKGNFSSPQALSIPAPITALASGHMGLGQSSSDVLVGISGQKGSSLLVFAGGKNGLAPAANYPLAGAATSFVFGDLDGDAIPDAAILAGAQVLILHSTTNQLETVYLPIAPISMVAGSFIHDRNPGLQLALLASDGSISIAARSGFDPRALSLDEVKAKLLAGPRGRPNSSLASRPAATQQTWSIVESFAGAAPSVARYQPPVMFRTRISSNGADDVMVLNAYTGQMTLISHPNQQPGAATFVPGQVTYRPYTGSPLAAMPLRVNIDGRPGFVALHQGQLAPSVLMPLPDPTFFPNRTDDPVPTSPIANACNNVSNADPSSSCSLREAILKANSIAGTDTIMLAAGTYTLSRPKVAGDYSGTNGALYVNDSVNIVGAGQGLTFIQGGSTNANGVDMVIAVNEDISPLTDATASISNLTIRFGRNTGSIAVGDSDGGGMEFDTGTSGNANLTMTNVTLSDSSTTDGFGGGIALFNFLVPAGTGQATFTNCIIQNNTVAGLSGRVGSGGGIFNAITAGIPARIVINNSQIINNTATQISGSSQGTGGGIFIFGPASGAQRPAIHGSTISGNQSASDAGGIYSTSGIVVDQGTVISNNVSGGSGGGIWLNIFPDTADLSKITVTGNSAATDGGGIRVDDAGGTVNIHFSRFSGNTAGGLGSNLSNRFDPTPDNGTFVSATNNWWGTNTPGTTLSPSTSSCVGVRQICFDPFIQLTFTAAPSTIRINQSTTLTADMSLDNHGSGAALAGNLDVLNALPVLINSAFLGSIPDAQPESLSAGAQATATFNAGAIGGAGSANAKVDQQTVTANIIILQPLQITKTFSPLVVPVNTPSTVTFSINNPNSVATDANFTDTLPSNTVVAAIPNVVNGCGGTVTAVAGANSITFSNPAIPAGPCVIKVDVSGTVDGNYDNTVTINSVAAGTNPQSTSTGSFTVINPPTILKNFGAATLLLNGTTSLSFTVSTTNSNLVLTGIAFNDLLPPGLVVSTPSLLNSTCSGTATAVAGSFSATLSGATLPPGASCQVTLNVTGTAVGAKVNSVTVTAANNGGLTGNTSNASITVVTPPVIIKAFGAASIPLTGTTTLSFTINNANATTAFTGVAFTDVLPAGMAVATPNFLTGSCGTGIISAGANVISLSGGTIAASGSCTFSVNVIGNTAGTKNNTTGNVTSTEGGTGGTASASVAVVAPPSIAKAFVPATIALNSTSSLNFTITNPAANTLAEAGVAFNDVLPAGLTVVSGSVPACGGTLTTTAPTGISLAGATVAVNSQCLFSVTVTGAASGHFTNTTGNVSSTNGGTGNTATASLTVASPPTITKAFGAATVPLNGTTSLTFTINNPNLAVTLNGLAFTDNLPAGLVVAATPNLIDTCGGTATAVGGSGVVTLTTGTLASTASCTVSLNVQGTTAGVKNNSVTVTSTEGGPGNTSNASLTVVAPPVIIKAFGAASIPLTGTTTLSFTINNANATTAFTGVAFTDVLPAGLAVATPNFLTGSCGTGIISAGANVISLSGGTIAASGSCTFSVNVIGNTAGTKNNTTGNVTSTEGGTGGTASASIDVVAPPSLAKAFAPQNIGLNGTSTLTFTATNPAANAVPLSVVAFTDNFPAGIVVATPNGLVSNCAGAVTANPGSGSVSLNGGGIPVNSNCTISVNVVGTASGVFTNTTGTISSGNGGTGNTASATLSVAAPPVILKSFGSTSIPLNGSTSLSFTVTNPAANAIPLAGVAFTDSLPAGLIVATPNGLAGTCGGGTITALSGSGAVSLAAATLAANGSCTFSVNVTGTTAGLKNNSVAVTSTTAGAGNTSNANITVLAPPVIIKAFGAASVPLNGSTSLTFTINNANATTALSGVGFADAFPAGLVISTPNGLAGTCGAGTITAVAGSGSVTLTGAALPASGSCNFSVNVTGTAAGTENNTTGNVTSVEGGTGGTASASLAVVAPPSISKAFNPTAIAPNTNSALTFTITNPGANTVALTGVAFTDNLPAGTVVATPNGLAGNCGAGTITAVAGSSSITLAGGTIATSATCTFSVNITATAPGSAVNTTGAVTSTNGGTGNTASATLTVASPPSITKNFGAASIGLGGTTSLSFTVTNPNSFVALTGVAFTDAIPAGLVVSTPNGLTGTCGAGVITATAGSSSVTLAGGTIAVSASCTFAVNVSATAPGNKVNTTGTVSATNGGVGSTATASINVLAPDLTISKSHSGNFGLGQTGATYTLTVNNLGPGPTAGTVTVTDTLPASLTATSIAGTGWVCTLATLTCTRADALAAAASYPGITVTVNVAANAPNSVTNNAAVSGGGELNVANDSAADVTLVTTFTLSASNPTVTIHAGQLATFNLTVTPVGGAFTSPISFLNSGTPAKTTVSFSPSPVTPGANPAAVAFGLQTTAGLGFVSQNSPEGRIAPFAAIVLPFGLVLLIGIGANKLPKDKKKASWLALALIVFCFGMGIAGCVGPQNNFNNLGTPAGTYPITVTASANGVPVTVNVTLIVQP